MSLNSILGIVFNLTIAVAGFVLARAQKRNAFGWFFLCLFLPFLIVVLYQTSHPELKKVIPKVGNWVVRTVLIVLVFIGCIKLGNAMQNIVLLCKFEAYVLSKIFPLKVMVENDIAYLVTQNFKMAIPGGLLNTAMAMCAVGGALGGLIFFDQPRSAFKLMGYGFVVGLTVRIIKDVVFVLGAWVYSFSGDSYEQILFPTFAIISTVIMYCIALLTVKKRADAGKKEGEVCSST